MLYGSTAEGLKHLAERWAAAEPDKPFPVRLLNRTDLIDKDRAEFLLVYIREAHPEDGWKTPQNERQGIRVLQPKTLEQRQEVAHTCSAKLDIKFPMLIDGMDNQTEQSYAAWPDRLYTVNTDGRIVYKSAPGPAGFKAADLGAALQKLLDPATRPAR